LVRALCSVLALCRLGLIDGRRSTVTSITGNRTPKGIPVAATCRQDLLVVVRNGYFAENECAERHYPFLSLATSYYSGRRIKLLRLA